MKINLNNKYVLYCFFVSLIGLVISLFVKSDIEQTKLDNDHIVTNAKIIDFTSNARSAGVFYIKYVFFVNGKKYVNENSMSKKELDISDCKYHFVGKTFPVVYYPKDPSINILLNRPFDFKRFKISFPDSLNWIRQYVHDDE